MNWILACPSCISNFSSGGDAAGWAILVMLLIIVPMLSGIIFLFVKLARREREHFDPNFSD